MTKDEIKAITPKCLLIRNHQSDKFNLSYTVDLYHDDFYKSVDNAVMFRLNIFASVEIKGKDTLDLSHTISGRKLQAVIDSLKMKDERYDGRLQPIFKLMFKDEIKRIVKTLNTIHIKNDIWAIDYIKDLNHD